MGKDWPRPVVLFEIEARDPDLQRTFYGTLFNWDITDAGPLKNFSAGIGGPEPGPGGHIRGSRRSGVTLYIQVRDLTETLAKAVELGGKVLLERMDVPGGPTIAGITDPEDNPVMLVQQ